MLDNYDSFVFNLARYVKELGFDCLVARNDEITLNEIQTEIKPTHIIISPGPGTPKEAGVCLSLVEHFKKAIPILGVCLGHQVIGQVFGGSVVKALMPMHGKASCIEHDAKGLFKNLPSPLQVGRYHSLIVEKTTLPSCLNANAFSTEGEIMALKHNEFPIYGVQFHPESVLTEHGHTLLNNFLQDHSSQAGQQMQ